MALHEVLIYVCWIQYKIMLFVCASVLIELHHHYAIAYLRMNLLYTYDVKNSLYNIVWNFQLPLITHDTTPLNPAYNSVFNCKFKRFFDLKPNQMPPLGIRLQPELQAVGFKKKGVLHCSVPSKPPWLFKRPQIDFSMHNSCRESTPPEIFRAKYYEICISIKTTANSIQMDLWVVIK